MAVGIGKGLIIRYANLSFYEPSSRTEINWVLPITVIAFLEDVQLQALCQIKSGCLCVCSVAPTDAAVGRIFLFLEN